MRKPEIRPVVTAKPLYVIGQLGSLITNVVLDDPLPPTHVTRRMRIAKFAI